MDRINPFNPDSPVDPNNFEGREDILEKNIKILMETKHNKPKHFFITGNRGMGKSSLASYFKDYAEKKLKYIGVHIYNDGVHDIESLIRQIIEELLNNIQKESFFNKIFNSFKNHVESVNLFGTSLKFKPSENLLDHIKDNFAGFLVNMVNEFDNKNGLIIIIDDINGLSDNPEFVNWYKSFADTLFTNYRGKSPICMILAGYPEKLEIMHENNPSFTRIFSHIKLKGLSDKEITDFFNKSFNKINMGIDPDAIDILVKYSSGLPNMMQEIGNGTFYMTNDDDLITYYIAFKGVLYAGDEIGKKYLQPLFDSSIRSMEYLGIFEKIAKDAISNLDEDYFFRKKDFSKNLTENEKKVFTNFLNRARKLKILDYHGPKKSGYYKFTNNLYPVYIDIQSLDETQNKNRL
ncbi:MAG: ATP-binding protein [Methanobrevibacter sp.]|nr:ATP-binding protein [Methanobrevibacter sp.]